MDTNAGAMMMTAVAATRMALNSLAEDAESAKVSHYDFSLIALSRRASAASSKGRKGLAR